MLPIRFCSMVLIPVALAIPCFAIQGPAVCPVPTSAEFCDVRSPGVPLPYVNPIAPPTPTLTSNVVDVVILGHSESAGYHIGLQPMLNANPPVPGVTFNVTNLFIGGHEAWRWATPGEQGYQQIETLIQTAQNPVIVLGLFSNNQTFPIQMPDSSDPNFELFVDDLLSISEHVHNQGQTASLVYLSAHRYRPDNVVPSWNENCAMGEVMSRAATAGMSYLKPGPEQHNLHWCCFPTCYAQDQVHPNILGRQLMAETWFAFLHRELGGMGSSCEGAVNSTGGPAQLTTTGSNSIAANDLALHVTGGAPNRPGLFFYGATETLLPLGNGVLCVGGGVKRLLPVQTIDGAGNLDLNLDLTMAPFNSGSGAVSIGSTKVFQLWYRDPPAGGAAFNLSGARAVTFVM